MRKFIFLLAVLPMVMLSSCSKDDKDDNPYLSALYGTWIIESIEGVDASDLGVRNTTATFYEGGTYRGSGYFGTGSGTYELEGKTITCYINGRFYVEYYILSLNGNRCQLRMSSSSGTSLVIECVKINK